MIRVKEMRQTWIWLSLFSIAMAFMESAVVLYLREISYPEGFTFPLVPMNGRLAVTEVLREAATLIMLMAAGYLGGRTFSERFAWFLYCFAVWDIFYYVFLKLLLGWPESLLIWDILFLIPAPWVGPVITPVLVSCTMILLAVTILHFTSRNAIKVCIRPLEWTLLITGSIVLILSYTWDFFTSVIPVAREEGQISISTINQWVYHYVPRQFNWFLYIAGEIIILTGIFLFYYRCRKNQA